jgi:hypothetical protein
MGKMVSADGEGIAVAAKDEEIEVLPAEGDAGGKGQRAAVNEMDAVALHKIRETAAATNAGDGGDFLVMDAAVLDELEIECEHGEIAATGAPRGVIGCKIFFLQRFAGDFCSGAHGVN